MNILYPFLHLDWSEFFNSSVDCEHIEKISHYLNISADNNYYISLCHFIYLNETGAVCIEGSPFKNHKFLIDTSIFEYCGHKSDSGGSLYVGSGECIQDRICSFGSKAKGKGVYCYALASFEGRNYLLGSTVTSSGEGSINIYLDLGKIIMKSINISNSNLVDKNFYYIYYSSVSNVTLSTFSNNTHNKNDCESYHHGFANTFEFKILFCNYIDNNCYTLIYCDTILHVSKCSFYKNYINSFYFSTSEYILVSECYFDIQNLGISGSIKTTNNVSSIYPENYHLSTGLCFAKLKFEDAEKIKNNEIPNTHSITFHRYLHIYRR